MLWIARIFTNVLIDIIPGINRNYPLLIVLGVSLSFEFASTTIVACALGFFCFRDVKTWLDQHFPGKPARWLARLYRAILLTYGFRMLALFLYDSFLVVRHITRQSEYKQIDSILLTLDAAGLQRKFVIFLFRQIFEFSIPEVLNADENTQLEVEEMTGEGEIEEREPGVEQEDERENNAELLTEFA